MFPMGLFVKPTKPSKHIPIKLVDNFKDVVKKKHRKKNKTKKKLVKAPL